jgi:hypothetical protein
MSDEPAKIVILSIFLFTVAIMLISFHSQLGSQVFSSAIFLAAAILSFLMALLLPFFFLIGIVNVLSFGYNFKKVRRPELTRKQLFLLIILLITILPIFIPYSFEVEGKNRIILQFYTKPEDIPEEAIPVLREREIELLLSISPSGMEKNATEITRKLNDEGIKIYATLCLEEEQGIYAHDGNVQEFIEHYHAFRNWAKEKRLEFEGILIDSEPDWRFLNRITLLSRKGDLIGIERELANQINDTEHKNAIEKYKELIDEAKKDGYEIILIGMPTVVDDLLDVDDFLQRIQGISSIPPVGWDKETFMIYRSTYENTLGYDFGSYLVYSYGRTVKEIFPRGSISIGVVGYFSEPKFFLNHSTYVELDQISDDIIVLNGLGFSEVQIFSLRSFIETFGIDGLRNIEPQGKIKVTFSKEVAIIRGGTLIFDRLQDIFK